MCVERLTAVAFHIGGRRRGPGRAELGGVVPFSSYAPPADPSTRYGHDFSIRLLEFQRLLKNATQQRQLALFAAHALITCTQLAARLPAGTYARPDEAYRSYCNSNAFRLKRNDQSHLCLFMARGGARAAPCAYVCLHAPRPPRMSAGRQPRLGWPSRLLVLWLLCSSASGSRCRRSSQSIRVLKLDENRRECSSSSPAC